MEDEKEKIVMDLLKLVQPGVIMPIKDFKISELIRCPEWFSEWLNNISSK